MWGSALEAQTRSQKVPALPASRQLCAKEPPDNSGGEKVAVPQQVRVVPGGAGLLHWQPVRQVRLYSKQG